MSPNNLVPTSKPRVKIFSSPNHFTLSLIDSLLANFCQIEVITEKTTYWEKLTDYLTGNKNFSINSREKQTLDCDYLLGVFIDEIDLAEIKRILIESRQSSIKTLFVFPYKQDFKQKVKINAVKEIANKNFSETIIVYIGDHVGPRMTFNESSFSQIIKSSLLSVKVFIPNNQDYFPVFTPDAAREIVKILFSFGPPASEVAVYSERLSPEELRLRMSRAISSKDFVLENGGPRVYNDDVYVVNTPKRLEFSLNEVYGWFSSHPYIQTKRAPSTSKKRAPEIVVPRVKLSLNIKTKPGLVIFLTTPLFLIALPFILLFFSLLTLKTGSDRLLSYHTASSAKYLKVSKNLASGSIILLGSYRKIPLLGASFNGSHNSATIVYGLDEAGLKLLDITQQGSGFLAKIFGNEVYKPDEYANKIAVSLDGLYRDLAFLDSEINASGGLTGKLIKKFSQKVNLSDVRHYILSVKSFVEKTPILLGEIEPTSYLIIFQNNMELRPTGGFVGSYAIASFDEGRLNNLDIQDVYSSDGQLKGHVEPPEPIKRYLGEANWYLRDANWDPDFPSTAARIEWFLSKEIDRSVNGVVAIDLEVAKRFLTLTGPVELKDFNERVSADNLYEKTQTEVQEQFFPGSIKKDSFLTALANSLLNKVLESTRSSPMPFLRPLFSLLQERHIQIFLHDSQLQKILSETGFSGEVLVPSCLGNCYSDWVGLVEANLGVNKANYYIERSTAIKITLSKADINRELSVILKNNANPAAEQSGVYKDYFRVLLPQDADVSGFFIKSGEDSEALDFETRNISGMKEIGTIIEVLPGQTKNLLISWKGPNNLDFLNSGEYRFYWRKQAGTGNDPVTLMIFTPDGIRTSFWPELALTGGGSYVYNTTLARDLFSRVSW